jgi:hypothetical protein
MVVYYKLLPLSWQLCMGSVCRVCVLTFLLAACLGMRSLGAGLALAALLDRNICQGLQGRKQLHIIAIKCEQSSFRLLHGVWGWFMRRQLLIMHGKVNSRSCWGHTGMCRLYMHSQDFKGSC